MSFFCLILSLTFHTTFHTLVASIQFSVYMRNIWCRFHVRSSVPLISIDWNISTLHLARVI